MTEATTASVLFQTAYESRYTWDENFPGYSADVQLVNEVTSVLKFEGTFKKFGNYFLMTKQVIQEYMNGQRPTTEFSYPNIKLLEPATIYS